MPEQAGELSKALVLYLGFGTKAFPQTDSTRVIQVFGGERGLALTRQCEALVTEARGNVMERRLRSPNDAAARVTLEMSRRYSNLDTNALAALGWDYSYQWR